MRQVIPPELILRRFLITMNPVKSSHHFNTPPWFLNIVRKLDPRGIGLDPCSNTYSLVQARTAYVESDNGLAQSWRGHGLLFMNPPHSQSPYNIEPWMQKAHEEFVVGTGDPLDQFVGLVPCKTDTQWFHEHVVPMHAICFPQKRIEYWLEGVPTEGGGQFASIVVYHGCQVDYFAALFGPLGLIVT